MTWGNFFEANPAIPSLPVCTNCWHFIEEGDYETCFNLPLEEKCFRKIYVKHTKYDTIYLLLFLCYLHFSSVLQMRWWLCTVINLQVNLCQKLFFLQIMGRTCCVQKLFSMHTANPNPVQLTGKPCKSIPTGKYLLSLQGNPVLIAGSLFSLQGFPCISLYFPVRDCSAVIISAHNMFFPGLSLEFSSIELVIQWRASDKYLLVLIDFLFSNN